MIFLDFFPENDSTKHDLLDYAYEINYFDQHLSRMLASLEEQGMLENTIVIVTADNGMPFPRVKGQAYERSNHLPLAIMWAKGIENPGRTVEDFVSFADFAPTVLELAGIPAASSGMQPMEGKSLMSILKNKQQAPHRQHILVGKERHDIGRPNDGGYPIRGIRTGQYLFLMNLEPDRWPSGNPETGYLNCDAGAIKSVMLHQKRYQGKDQYWQWAFGKRPAEELYDIKNDPDCLHNLADQGDMADVKQLLKTTLLNELKTQGDPRVNGNGEFFDSIEYMDSKNKGFYERFMNGDIPKTQPGWVSPDDFEEHAIQ